MTKLIAFGFTARERKDNPEFEFKPHKGTNDPLKQAAQIEAKREAARQLYPFMPYVGTLDTIVLCDVAEQQTVAFKHSKKETASMAAWNWIVNNCPMPSTSEVLNRTNPETLFVGWRAKQFIKCLALECLEAQMLIPPSFWYSSGNYRDMQNILFPFSPSTDIPLSLPLQRLGVECPDDYKPHRDAEVDAAHIVALLHALNITGDSLNTPQEQVYESALV